MTDAREEDGMTWDAAALFRDAMEALRPDPVPVKWNGAKPKGSDSEDGDRNTDGR